MKRSIFTGLRYAASGGLGGRMCSLSRSRTFDGSFPRPLGPKTLWNKSRTFLDSLHLQKRLFDLIFQAFDHEKYL